MREPDIEDREIARDRHGEEGGNQSDVHIGD